MLNFLLHQPVVEMFLNVFFVPILPALLLQNKCFQQFCSLFDLFTFLRRVLIVNFIIPFLFGGRSDTKAIFEDQVFGFRRCTFYSAVLLKSYGTIKFVVLEHSVIASSAIRCENSASFMLVCPDVSTIGISICILDSVSTVHLTVLVWFISTIIPVATLFFHE